MKHILTIINHTCHCEGRLRRMKQSLFPFKNITGHVLAIMIVLLLFLPVAGFAESKEIISEGAYNMGDGETPSVAESRALLQAKRTALEQAGTYVESYSKVKDLKLTEDEIQVLASGLMEVEILDKKRTVVGDGIHFWVKIKARVNLDKTEELANRIKAKDRAFVEDYKKIQEAYDKSQKDIEELKKELSQAKGETQKKQVEAKISDDERHFQANELMQKGKNYYLNKEYDKAREAVASAIALDPNYADSLDPNYADAYIQRGTIYGVKGEFDRAIEDYNKAISLDPNNAAAYTNRGVAYGSKSQYDRAIEDFNKAIALDSNDAISYVTRGLAYFMKGQYERAIEDYNKAIALDPKMPMPYVSRGIVYNIKGNMGMAVSDFQKACNLGFQQGCEILQKTLRQR